MGYSKQNTGWNVIGPVDGLGQNGSRIDVWAEWTETDISIPNNTSKVTVKLYASLKTGQHSDTRDSNGGKSYITIGGTEYTVNTVVGYDFRQVSIINYFGAKTVTVTHDPDGSKSLTLGGRFTTSSSYITGGNVSATRSLSVIPQASSASVSPATIPIDGTSQATLTITRASSAFTHKVTVTLGTKSQTFNNVATSQVFTLPTTWLSEVPAATAMNGTISVQTYNSGTALGDPVTVGFTATVPSTVKPAISSVAIAKSSDNATVTSWDEFVQNFSKAIITVTATPGTNSSIVSYSFTIGNNSPVVQASNVYDTGIFTVAGTFQVGVVVTDARGRTATWTSTVQTIYAYTTPTVLSARAYRCDANGYEDDDGTFVRAMMTYAYSSVNGHNSLDLMRITYKWNDSGDDNWTVGQQNCASNTYYKIGGTGATGPFDVARVYTLRFTVRDLLGKWQTITRVISTAGVPFNIKPSGKGIGIGKYAGTDNLLDVAWDANFDGDVTGVSKAGTWTFASGWQANATADSPVVRRWGPFVYLRGIIKPTGNVTLNATEVKVGSITAAMAPKENTYFLCQGYQTMMYLLSVRSNGDVYISRNRNIANSNNNYTQGTTSTTFMFSVSWLI